METGDDELNGVLEVKLCCGETLRLDGKQPMVEPKHVGVTN